MTGPVGKEPVWLAETPSGKLSVTVARPHEVVRFEPPDSAGGPQLPDLPSLPALPSRPGRPSLPPLPSALLPAGPFEAPAAPAGAPGRLDFTRMSPADVDAAFRTLIAQVDELDRAVDTSYQFNLRGAAAFSGCGPGACGVSATISTSFVSRTVKPVGNVNAEMTVFMTGDGAPVGGCATVGVLPVNGTAVLSCVNVSPAWSAYYARAIATRGTHVYTARVVVVATAVGAEVIDAIINRMLEEHERYMREHGGGNTRSARPSGSRPCQPQRPTYATPVGGRARSASAVLCPPLQKGTPASVDPPGFPTSQTRRSDNTYEFDRGHLLGAQLGGSGSDPGNIVTLYSAMNQSPMRQCENRVADAVNRDQQRVEITVTANYVPNKIIPDSVTIRATGDGGFTLNVTLANVDSKALNGACTP